ncbi:DNA adenine methylase [Candidatus Parcubacteria bacterium]|nr:DNA adenine methylase [Candidatus Parcubacteria bacterium]
MPKFNDINLDKWKDSDIWTDSLWIIQERDKSGKHDGFYHGNFVPQIPKQLIQRYTKKNEIVFDPFLGSGTTAYECENLNRNFIGVEIQPELVKYVQNKIDSKKNFFEILSADSSNERTFLKIQETLKKRKRGKVQLAILHPPYANIIKFSKDKKDLSNAKDLKSFLNQFSQVIKNTITILEKNRYLAIVMGDKYEKGKWIPLSFYCLNEAYKLGLTLKCIIIKNMAGNRAKQNREAIWRYRALASDYYIFKHEYILVFKNG